MIREDVIHNQICPTNQRAKLKENFVVRNLHLQRQKDYQSICHPNQHRSTWNTEEFKTCPLGFRFSLETKVLEFVGADQAIVLWSKSKKATETLPDKLCWELRLFYWELQMVFSNFFLTQNRLITLFNENSLNFNENAKKIYTNKPKS